MLSKCLIVFRLQPSPEEKGIKTPVAGIRFLFQWLQPSPEEKGIKTVAAAAPANIWRLQPSPEEKGIKTHAAANTSATAAGCSRALKKKGLRRKLE